MTNGWYSVLAAPAARRRLAASETLRPARTVMVLFLLAGLASGLLALAPLALARLGLLLRRARRASEFSAAF